MEPSKIVGIVLVTIVLATIIVAIAVVLSKNRPSTSLSGDKWWGWKRGIIPVTLGFIALYIDFWFLGYRLSDVKDQEMWHGVMSHWFFLFSAAIATLFALMLKRDPNKPFSQKFGRVGLWIVVISCVLYFTLSHYGKKPVVTDSSNTSASNKSSAFGNTPTASQPPDTSIPSHEETPDEKVVREKIGESDLSDFDKEYMIRHAWDETKFHQFGPDKKVTVHKNKNGTMDHGIFQINDVWLPVFKQLGKSHDVNTLEGNITAAIYVFRKQGHQAWKRGVNGEILAVFRPVLVMAPVAPAWSKPIPITRAMNWANAKTINVCFNEDCSPEKVMAFEPDSTKITPNIVAVQFQSAGDKEIPVVYAFK